MRLFIFLLVMGAAQHGVGAAIRTPDLERAAHLEALVVQLLSADRGNWVHCLDETSAGRKGPASSQGCVSTCAALRTSAGDAL
jgi:hypothetical protein